MVKLVAKQDFTGPEGARDGETVGMVWAGQSFETKTLERANELQRNGMAEVLGEPQAEEVTPPGEEPKEAFSEGEVDTQEERGEFDTKPATSVQDTLPSRDVRPVGAAIENDAAGPDDNKEDNKSKTRRRKTEE